MSVVYGRCECRMSYGLGPWVQDSFPEQILRWGKYSLRTGRGLHTIDRDTPVPGGPYHPPGYQAVLRGVHDVEELDHSDGLGGDACLQQRKHDRRAGLLGLLQPLGRLPMSVSQSTKRDQTRKKRK